MEKRKCRREQNETSIGIESNACWIQRKNPQEFPSNGRTEAVPWVSAAGDHCPECSSPFPNCFGLGMLHFPLMGHLNPRCSSWKLKCLAPNRTGLNLGVGSGIEGLHLGSPAPDGLFWERKLGLDKPVGSRIEGWIWDHQPRRRS